MILQEKIQKKAEEYGQLAAVFLEGAKFALENQWISVDDKMPYEYPEILASRDTTVPILTKTERLGYFVQNMYYIEHRNEWEFSEGGGVESWMPILKTTKRIGDKTIKRTKEEIEKLQRYMNRIFPYYYRDNSIREGIKSIVNAIPKMNIFYKL